MSKLCAQEDVGGLVNGRWKSRGRAFFPPACWFNDEGDQAVLHGLCEDLFLISGLKHFKSLERVCAQKVLQVQLGPQGWAAPPTSSLLCLSDQTAGSSCHVCPLININYRGSCSLAHSSSTSPTSSSIHLTGLIIEPSGGEEF